MLQINTAHSTTVSVAAAVFFYAVLRARGQCLTEIIVTCHGGVRNWLYMEQDHQQNTVYGKWLATDITSPATANNGLTQHSRATPRPLKPVDSLFLEQTKR